MYLYFGYLSYIIVLDEPCQHTKEINCDVTQRSKGQGHLITFLTKFQESVDYFPENMYNSKESQSILHQSILQSAIHNFTKPIVSTVTHTFKFQGHIKVK